MAALKKYDLDLIDTLHHHDIHVPTRTIFLRRSDYIDGESSDPGVDHLFSSKFLKNLHLLESISSDPITIILSTPGGDCYQGAAVYDAIRSSLCYVTIVVRGECCSMGSYILQAADKRLMAEHSILMVHLGEESHSGHPKIVRNWVKFEEQYGNKLDEILKERVVAKRPEYRGKKFEEMMNFDTIMTAEKAVEMGLADEVLYSSKE